MIEFLLLILILVLGYGSISFVEFQLRSDGSTAKVPVLVKLIPALLALLAFFLNVVVLVQAGHVGVIKRLGAVAGTMNPGLNFKTPFLETVEILDTRVQKDQVDAEAASKDLQTVKAAVALNYRLRPDMVDDLYQSIGSDYKERVIDPAIRSEE